MINGIVEIDESGREIAVISPEREKTDLESARRDREKERRGRSAEVDRLRGGLYYFTLNLLELETAYSRPDPQIFNALLVGGKIYAKSIILMKTNTFEFVTIFMNF
jgi:hypothetical protein